MATNLEDKVRELEAKVAELYDREAIRDLRFRYHECINEAQMAEIPDLFTEDGELEFGHLGRAKGREQIKAFFGGLGADRTHRWHAVGAGSIASSSSSITMSSRCMAIAPMVTPTSRPSLSTTARATWSPLDTTMSM